MAAKCKWDVCGNEFEPTRYLCREAYKKARAQLARDTLKAQEAKASEQRTEAAA